MICQLLRREVAVGFYNAFFSFPPLNTSTETFFWFFCVPLGVPKTQDPKKPASTSRLYLRQFPHFPVFVHVQGVNPLNKSEVPPCFIYLDNRSQRVFYWGAYVFIIWTYFLDRSQKLATKVFTCPKFFFLRIFFWPFVQ